MAEKMELLPCPFCGGNATITEQEDEDGRFAAVICLMCGAGSRQHYFIGDDARPHVVGAWNKRTHHAEIAEVVKALEYAKADALAWRTVAKGFVPESSPKWFVVTGTNRAVNPILLFTSRAFAEQYCAVNPSDEGYSIYAAIDAMRDNEREAES